MTQMLHVWNVPTFTPKMAQTFHTWSIWVIRFQADLMIVGRDRQHQPVQTWFPAISSTFCSQTLGMKKESKIILISSISHVSFIHFQWFQSRLGTVSLSLDIPCLLGIASCVLPWVLRQWAWTKWWRLRTKASSQRPGRMASGSADSQGQTARG